MTTHRKYMDSPMGRALAAEEAKRGYEMAIYEIAQWLHKNYRKQVKTLDEGFIIARAELIVREVTQ